jgi:AcrR family transcriptional regulator
MQSLHAPTLANGADAQPAKTERRYGGLSAQEREHQRREKLLGAAVQVFGTLGLRKATIRDICHEARLAERYFAEHFSSAADAYEAAFKILSQQALAATGSAMAQSALNTRALAQAGLGAFLHFVQEDPRRAQILLVDASSYWRHVTIRSNPELNQQAQAMSHLAGLIYPDLPAHIELEIIGAALIGSSLQACLIWVQNGFRQPIEQVVDHLMFIWDGLDHWFRAEIQAGAHPAQVQHPKTA